VKYGQGIDFVRAIMRVACELYARKATPSQALERLTLEFGGKRVRFPPPSKVEKEFGVRIRRHLRAVDDE